MPPQVSEQVGNSRQKYRRALEQARKITAMLQGTMGLEGQGRDKKTLKEMTRRTAEELLSSKR
jgi:hypothetical protein